MPSNINNERHLKMSLIDPDKLVKVNELKEVSNPVAFIRKGVPTPDGLWSNEIFGITQYQRANTFAYIDLYEEFINPLIYKTWCKIDSEIKNCVHGIKNYKINDHGQLEEDENGSNGIQFLKKNMSKYKFRHTDSNKRDMNIDFIKSYIGKPEFFISKYIQNFWNNIINRTFTIPQIKTCTKSCVSSLNHCNTCFSYLLIYFIIALFLCLKP